MKLYVLRHGEAADHGDPRYPNDADRPLTAKGAQRTKALAHALRQWNLSYDVIFSSPFANHHSTARGEPVRILFDTDMGSDCDDAGALAILHVYADRGLAEILGCIYSSGQVPYGAGVVQAINIYYGRPKIPIGAAHDDKVGDPVDKMTAEKLAKDTAAFGNTIIHRRDAEEMTALNRRRLAGVRRGQRGPMDPRPAQEPSDVRQPQIRGEQRTGGLPERLACRQAQAPRIGDLRLSDRAITRMKANVMRR